MSDVERPTDSGGAQEGGHGQKLPARNMADIARMFLDGARPMAAPRRVPPKAAAPAASKPVQTVMPESTDHPKSTALLGLAAGRDSASHWKLLTLAAQGVAVEQGTSVAIVGFVENGPGTSFIVDIVGVESADELPMAPMASDTGAGTPDLQMARALHRLHPAVGFWIIAAPPPESRNFPAIASIARQWLLASPTDNDGLVAAYQLLKQSFMRANSADLPRITPSVFLLSDDYAHAAIVHKRLRKAAHEFLRTDLVLAGAGPVHSPGQEKHGHAGPQPPIRALSIACTGPTDALWATLLDELCPMSEADEPQVRDEIEAALDHVQERAAQVERAASASAALAFDHLAQVLDPEERDALTAGLYDVPNPPMTPELPEMRAQPVKIPVMAEAPVAEKKIDHRKLKIEKPAVVEAPASIGTVPAAIASMTNTPTLRALDLESQAPDRTAQWQAVERSIWDLSPRCALLDAKPPMSWATETCIAIDHEGRLNVWTLFKDASGGASWFALREWAREHKNLLALTRRDLTLNPEAEVAVHIVLPLDPPTPSADDQRSGHDPMQKSDPIPVLLRTPAKNIHLYRLRTVQWNNKQGLIVVPIA